MLGLSVESGAKVRIIFEYAKDFASFLLYDAFFLVFCSEAAAMEAIVEYLRLKCALRRWLAACVGATRK